MMEYVIKNGNADDLINYFENYSGRIEYLSCEVLIAIYNRFYLTEKSFKDYPEDINFYELTGYS